MTDYQKMSFYNPTCGSLKFEDVVEEVFNYIKKKHNGQYEIVVGCDSSSGEQPAFPVVLVVLRKGRGGRFFLAKINYRDKKKFYSFRERILEEVYLSCEVALKFRDAFKARVEKSSSSLAYQFEYIHADVGATGPTREMIKEVVGLIKSNGFTPKIKPEAFAASIVADRFS